MTNPQLSRREAIKSACTTIGLGIGITSKFSSVVQGASSVTIEKNNRNSDLRDKAEGTSISPGLLTEIDASTGEQVRVGTTCKEADYKSAFYTVISESPSKATIEMSKSGLDRLGLKKDTTGFARGYAPNPGYATRAEADANDEYIEILQDDGEQSDLVACAVHGGWIEYRTDKQSEYVAEALDVTEWSCVGYNSGGGAYDRWHITSTDIAPASFPELNSISDRQFSHAVSFHGFSEDGIVIGGGAPDSLKRDMRDAIDVATDGRYDVSLATADEYSGDSPANFVNWLTTEDTGIQIEQGWDARSDDWDTIAAAVSQVYSDILDR